MITQMLQGYQILWGGAVHHLLTENLHRHYHLHFFRHDEQVVLTARVNMPILFLSIRRFVTVLTVRKHPCGALVPQYHLLLSVGKLRSLK